MQQLGEIACTGEGLRITVTSCAAAMRVTYSAVSIGISSSMSRKSAPSITGRARSMSSTVRLRMAPCAMEMYFSPSESDMISPMLDGRSGSEKTYSNEIPSDSYSSSDCLPKRSLPILVTSATLPPMRATAMA